MNIKKRGGRLIKKTKEQQTKRKYYLANKDKILAQQRVYKKTDRGKEITRIHNKKYQEENKEKLKEKRRLKRKKKK